MTRALFLAVPLKRACSVKWAMPLWKPSSSRVPHRMLSEQYPTVQQSAVRLAGAHYLTFRIFFRSPARKPLPLRAVILCFWI